MTIGGKILNVVTAFSYLGHIICNDLSDEADLKAKSRQMYAKSNTLRNKFHMCSTAVKVKLFTAYFNNVYMCALWVNYRKTAFQQFKVAYNNSYRILNRLPMRCSASNMFANGNVNSCACVLRKSIYSLMTRIHASLNPIVNSIVRGDVYCTSALRIQWVSQLYIFYVGLAFMLDNNTVYFFNIIWTYCTCMYYVSEINEYYYYYY